MKQRHGGDIYAPDIAADALDFSASINPLGMPEGVKQAAERALVDCVHYPDPHCRRLRQALAEREGVPPEWIFCGAGAADVLYRLMLALRPRKVWLPVPTFGEYARAAKLAGAQVVSTRLDEASGFALPGDIWETVPPDIDLFVLCTPNNPTGLTIDKRLVRNGLEHCRAVGARLLLDVCFQDFLDEPERAEFGAYLADYPLILLKSLTKLYAVPGLRLGYCVSAERGLSGRLAEAGAPWQVSGIAQACGIAAAGDSTHAVRTRALIHAQRERMLRALRALSFFVIDGEANFLLFRNDSGVDLAGSLRRRGILVRDCSSFEGLDGRWLRVAVRTGAENNALLHALQACL